MIEDFIALIYPRNCIACGNSLYKHEEQVCNYCYTHLPKTNYHHNFSNPVESLFYGRLELKLASSFYTFQKKGSVQKILHAIKYKSNKELAVLVGKWYAQDLLKNSVIQNTDMIIPVPLHHKKLKMRGYNQSEEFAKGLSEGLNKPLQLHVLKRTEFTSTQTQKNKYERWENVENVFEVNNDNIIKNKHIILVDDVVTTGATLEACAHVLKKIEGVEISILSIAYAEK